MCDYDGLQAEIEGQNRIHFYYVYGKKKTFPYFWNVLKGLGTTVNLKMHSLLIHACQFELNWPGPTGCKIGIEFEMRFDSIEIQICST